MFNNENKHIARKARQGHEVALKQRPRGSSRTSQRRHYTQPRNPFWLIGSLLVGVVVVIGLFIYIADHQVAAGVIGPTDPKVLDNVTHIKQDVFTHINRGGVRNILLATGTTQELTRQNGKPEIFYYGAEFCPYCGAQRWSLVVALSRFGTFSKLPEMLSSHRDVAPDTSTFTFVQSQYSSQYIDFVPVEVEDRNQHILQVPARHEQSILKQYHVSSFPFVDIADRYVASGPFFDAALLQNLSQKDIANKLSDANDNVTKNIVGGANYLTAAICSATHDQPANVCTQGPIRAIEQSLMHNTLLM